MTVYRTCFGCKVEAAECAKRAAISANIKGLGITSLKFKCSDRTPYFRIGQRVIADVVCVDEHAEEGYSNFSFKGTVVRDTGTGKFVVNLDHGPSECGDGSCPEMLTGNGFAKLTHSKLLATDEPDRPVCSTCHKTQGQDHIECYRSGYYYDPPGCLATPTDIASGEIGGRG